MILLDTCAVIRLSAAPGQLGAGAEALIRRHSDALGVSAITAFEMALVVQRGRVTLPSGFADGLAWYQAAVDHLGLREWSVTGAIAGGAALLPPLHADPFDRIIVATAQTYRVPIVTLDRTIPAYGVECVW